MKITIYGTGYVGLVSGTCLAELDHEVLCIDIDEHKIQQLQKGQIPIYEPGLEALVLRNQQAQRLHFSTDSMAGINHGEIQIIAVNTPTLTDGTADISNVLKVAETIAANMQDYKLIINKSTAPVGTLTQIKATIENNLNSKDTPFDIAANPEFLKEGAAIKDFMEPDRIIVGINASKAKTLLTQLYTKLADKLIFMDVPSAELTKYTANAMLATKISFMNEIANIAEKTGADIESVKTGIATDPRIGPHFINPGCGYGGSCFPKDVKALAHFAKTLGCNASLLDAVETVNNQQKLHIVEKIKHHFNNNVQGLEFALWGLAFKPNTDDMREASSRIVIDELIKAGASIKAYDPIAMAEAKKIYQHQQHLSFCDTALDALENANALIIVTEWDEFKNANPQIIKDKLKQPIIFDGRNIFEPTQLKEMGFRYFGIGR